jgi:3-isopropylmalate/(R)-2-methylmalate dehydratase small subunit
MEADTMERFDRLTAPALPWPQVNCDTDQIIPARYLQKLRSEDFGAFLFAGLRFDKNGAEIPDFPLNRPAYRQARIVVAGRNFGSGSSREHAVWALYDYGFRAAIAPSFGDIFFNNSLKNGLLPVVLPEDVVQGIIAMLSAAPGTELTVDLPAQTVILPDGAVHAFDVDPFAKECLVNGLDELGYTLSLSDAIDAFEKRYRNF